MSKSDGKKPESESAGGDKRSGRVAFDSRGNSVWEWQVQTGVYSTEVNTESLRKLEIDGLSLEDTAIRNPTATTAAGMPQTSPPLTSKQAPKKQPVVKERFDSSKAGGGFNPYDNSAAHGGHSSDPFRAARSREASASQTPARKSGARSKPAPTEVRKLSGWLKLKRALTGKA